MPRRASSRIHPGMIIGAVAGIVVAVFAGKAMLGGKRTAFADTSPLDIEEVLENANSLRGNQYAVEGQIDQKLQWTSDRGQLVSVKVDSAGGDKFIGIEIPAKFNRLNIDVRQKYRFRVKFRDGGIAVADGIERL